MASRITIKDIHTAVEIYYTYPELSSKEIMRLFGCSPSAASKLKHAARHVQKEKGIITFAESSVNTKCAYEAWHIDIADLEKRMLRMQKLMPKEVTA